MVTWQNPKLIFYVLENLISFLLEMRCLIGQWYQLFLSKLASRGTSLIKICVATRRLQSVRLLAIKKEPLNLLSRNDKPRIYFIFVKKKLSNIHRISYLQDHSAVTRYCVTLFKNTPITYRGKSKGRPLWPLVYLLFTVSICLLFLMDVKYRKQYICSDGLSRKLKLLVEIYN